MQENEELREVLTDPEIMNVLNHLSEHPKDVHQLL
jgi:ribosomal protein S15P/S13E